MDDIPEHPAFHKPPAVLTRIPSSTCSPQPERPERPRIPPIILELVTELGLRYLPSSQADKQAHAARVGLLAQDVADVNPLKLRLAIAHWVKSRPYLPKASELRLIAESLEEQPLTDLYAFCADRNAWAERMGMDWWYRVVSRDLPDGTPRREVEKLEGWRAIEERAKARGERVEWFKPTPDEAAEIHAKVARFIAANPDCTQKEFNRLVDEGRF